MWRFAVDCGYYPTYDTTVPEAMVFTTTNGSFQNQTPVTAAVLPVVTPNGRKRAILAL